MATHKFDGADFEARKQQKTTTKTATKGKALDQLKPKDKDDLLYVLAVEHGLI
jgi:hypothetical protein